MSSKTKKFAAVLFALAASVCLALALSFGIAPRTASADTSDTSGVLNFTEVNLTKDGDLITGLSSEAKTEIAKETTKGYTLTIGGNVSKIADEAFKGETKLTSLTITSSTLTEIGASAFYNTSSLTEIELNTQLTTIGEKAFAIEQTGNNNRLAEITVPQNVTSIGNLAFANRTRLATINFYATECGDFADLSQTSAQNAANANPFYMAGSQLLGGVTVNIGLAEDGNSIQVTKIPAAMFIAYGRASSKITTVNFKNVHLADGAFGDYSFYYCTNLQSVQFASSAQVSSIGERAFSHCTSLNTLVLPSSLKTIGKDSFNNALLTGITIPYLVTEIGDSAFKNCSSLASVGFEGDNPSLVTISKDAFYQCSALAAIVLPDTLKTIGERAFGGCTNLKTVEINGASSNLETIGNNAFNNCNSLNAIIIPKKVTTIGNAAYTGCTAVTAIKYYAESANDFDYAPDKHPFGNVGSAGTGITVEIDSVNKIPAYMFYYSSSQLNVTSVSFTKVNADISINAFNNCVNLSFVTFGSGSDSCSIGKIENSAFSGCRLLTGFDIPESVTSIGTNAFLNCRSILSITLPNRLATIGTNAFGGCDRLFVVVDLRDGSNLTPGDKTADGGVAANAVAVSGKDDASPITTSHDKNLGSVGLYFIKIEEGTSIKTERYYLIGSISTLKGAVVLPDNVPDTDKHYDIYQYAFQNNNNITSVEIPGTVGVINSYAFSQCSALESVTIADGVREIGRHVFAGCTALTSVTLPSGLGEIESELFQDCTSLTEITIPHGVTSIGSDAFNNTGLTSVEIPATVTEINTSAFANCKALTSVTFLAKETVGEDGNKYSLTNIGHGVFQNCTSLISVVIPETVVAVGGEAFRGASSLCTVYLPAHAAYESAVFDGCSANIVLISSSKEAYETYDRGALSSYRLTYLVKVNLIYGLEGNEEHIVYKLFNLDYSYELQDDGITWKNTGKKLPVQIGYEDSKWYSDEHYQTPVNEDQLAAMLRNTNISEEDGIILYAKYFAKPESYTLKTLNYKDDFEGNPLVISGGNYAAINARLFTESVFDVQHELRLIEYVPFIGSTQTNISSVLNAGDYTIEVTLDEAYGVWATPCYITFRVERQVVDISNTEYLNWVLSNGSQIGSETLWVPVSGSGDPYLADTDTENHPNGMPEGYKEELVEYSVVRYSGGSWQLKLANENNGMYTVSAYDGRIESKVGMYTAQAVVTPTNNYALQSGTFQYGMSCTPNNSADGSYTVYKVWYIVAMANTLWVRGTTEKYHVDDWTYNDENAVIPQAPQLSYGDNIADEIVTFTLSLEIDGVKTDLVADAKYNDFSKWINASMPAGTYTLKVNVVNAPSGNDDDKVTDMHETYVFEVKKAPLSNSIVSDLVSGINETLNGKTFRYAYNGLAQIAEEEVSGIIKSLSSSALNPNRTKVPNTEWFKSGYNMYYGEFSMSYYVSTMGSNIYLSSAELAASQYATKDAGVYVVYYQLSAPNYELLVNSIDDRYEYRFELVIYEEINTSSLVQSGGYVYTGNVITPLANNGKYQAISLEAGESLEHQDKVIRDLVLSDDVSEENRNYTDVGTAKIVLKISNPTIYKWIVPQNSNGVKVFGDNNEYLLLSFEIKPCQNSTTQALDIIRWTWDSYNADVNKPIWSTKYGTEYTFILISKNSRTYSQERFGEAPAGEYTLRATAAGGAGYNWETYTASATISILKADNYWDVVPTVYGWSYGEYATRVMGPAAKPHFGEASAVSTSYYKVNAEGAIDGQPYDSLSKLLVEGELPVGQYLMRVQLAGNSNYNAMAVTDIHFRVAQAYNAWLEVPYVVGWSEGGFDKTENSLRTGRSKFGEIIIKVTDSAGNVIDVDDFGKLSVGNYTVTAYVEGTENYYGMQPITTTFAVVEDSVSMAGLIAATAVFAVLAVGLAVAAIILLIIRNRQIEDEFRKMIKKELRRK